MIRKFAWRKSAVRPYGVQKGFTLAELLTAVLVISVIMVALAPVITKRGLKFILTRELILLMFLLE